MSRRDEKNILENLHSTASHQALLKLLRKLSLIEEKQVQTGVMYDDRLPIAYFAGCGMFDEWQAVQLVSKELHLPCQRLTAADIEQAQRLLVAEPCANVSEVAWKKLRAIPIAASDDFVKIVVANPLDFDGVKALEFELQVPIRSIIGLESEINNAWKSCESTALSMESATILADQEGLELRTPAGTASSLSFKIIGDTSSAYGSSKQNIGKRRVLLVDDDADVRAVMSALLEDSMYEVIQAADGKEALKAVYDRAPELVVCDLMMPKMSGREFVQALRNDKRTKNIPVIMLTAASTEENELELIRSGADDFVSKTAKSDILLARVGRLLGRAAA